jgi:hypothetical protein
VTKTDVVPEFVQEGSAPIVRETDFAAEVAQRANLDGRTLSTPDLPLAPTNPEWEFWELDWRERSTPYDVELLSIWGVGSG